MRTAEEWDKECDFMDVTNWVRAIQADAFKAGAEADREAVAQYYYGLDFSKIPYPTPPEDRTEAKHE